MNSVVELFGVSAQKSGENWRNVVRRQQCPFLHKTCYKVRKSDPSISIGSCTVLHGKSREPIVICPARLLERRQIFTDCLHLLTAHEPGNELHILPEVSVPGGNVDYFLVSTKNDTVTDFVGIELQTLDTTGTVWPERQRLLRALGVKRNDDAEVSKNTFGVNWKMTAKTILVQMHHKIRTFEHVDKNLVLVIQDKLLTYMYGAFKFDHLKIPASGGDSMHMHAYRVDQQKDQSYKLTMDTRLSTNADGIGTCLGLQAEPKMEIRKILQALQEKISPETLFNPI